MRSVFAFLFVAQFAVAADPAKPLAGAVIVVDPGHGGQSYAKCYTGGSNGVNSKITESELNLRVGLELAKLLEAEGATVFTTRTADHRLSRNGSSSKEELAARVEVFEHHACHFFISVHHNAATEKATGHTAIYKHDAKDDTLYEALAREINDSLATALPGPKRKLLKESYHLTRETTIPGTITEAGFMTNPEFDAMSIKPDFAKKEATATTAGAVTYWRTHHKALEAQRQEFIKARAESPKDLTICSNINLNPNIQSLMSTYLSKLAPDGKYDAAKVATYLAEFRKLKEVPVTDFKAAYADGKIKLSGKVTDRKEHDAFIDVLVAMKLLDIVNDCSVPSSTAKAKE
ncbi:hypothetical protein BH11PLA2_BH11PLA2_42160 [soil metagenome]